KKISLGSRCSKLIAIALTSSILLGCTSIGRLGENINTPAPNESIYILGLSPENHRALIFPGEMVGENYHQDMWRPASFYGSATDGYIIGKAKAGDFLGIVGIMSTESDRSLYGAQFGACGDQKTITFRAKPGGVVYIGDVSFKRGDKGLQFLISQDFNRAKTYLDRMHPKLAATVVHSEFELRKTGQPCEKKNTTLYVPIYIPKR
ncbi:hypothetical protein, partial [Aquabacterium lacunae]|uniref:hypothetical protein n=1 Tax=Aquabacterium lacunae TaxID=2528630 RepID=UPI0013EF3F4E